MTDITDIADELEQQIADNRDYVTFQIPACQQAAVVAKLRGPAVGGEGSRLSNWLADYSHDLMEDGDLDQEAAEINRASQWIADRLATTPAVGGEPAKPEYFSDCQLRGPGECQSRGICLSMSCKHAGKAIVKRVCVEPQVDGILYPEIDDGSYTDDPRLGVRR